MWNWFTIPRKRVIVSLNKDSVSLVVYVPGRHPYKVEEVQLFRLQKSGSDNIYSELENSLAAFVKEHGLEKVRCDVVLNPDWYRILLQTVPPQIKTAELTKFLRFQVKDLVDIPVEDILVEELFTMNNNVNERKGYVVIVDRRSMEKLSHCLGRCGLNVNSACIQESVMLDLGNTKRTSEYMAQLAFDQNNCLLTISQNFQLYFTRNFFIDEQDENFLWEEIQHSLNIGASELGGNEIQTFNIFPNAIFSNVQLLAISQKLGCNFKFLALETDHAFKDYVQLIEDIDYKVHWPSLGRIYQLSMNEQRRG